MGIKTYYEIEPVAAVRMDLEDAMNAFSILLEEKVEEDGWVFRLDSYQMLYAQGNYIVSGLVYRRRR